MVVIVFDLDGVIIDSAPIFVLSVNNALEHVGLKRLPEKEILDNFNLREIDESLKSWGININDQDMKNNFHNKFIEEKTKITPKPTFSKIEDFIKILNKKGVKLYILSGTSKKEVESFFKKYKILNYFKEVYFAEKRKAEKLQKIFKDENEKIYFVGDSVSDFQCAKDAKKLGANIFFIGLIKKKILFSKSSQINWSNSKEFKKIVLNEKNLDTKIIYNLTDIFKIILNNN